MEKKIYTIGISGTDGTSVQRELTEAEYLLVKGLCDDLKTQYESVEIYEGAVDLGY